MNRDLKLAEKISSWEKERNLIIDLHKSTKIKLIQKYLEELIDHIGDIINDLNEIKNTK